MRTTRIIAFALSGVMTLTMMAPMAAAQTAAPSAPAEQSAAAPAGVAVRAPAVPISGTSDQGTFNGTFRVGSFTARNGVLFAVGQLRGTLTDPRLEGGSQPVNRRVQLPVRNASVGSSPAAAARQLQQAPCEILTLVLGPLDLNLLGLRVQLNRINLRITGVPGAGNLLGNLLCAVAGLLDPPATGGGPLLTRILQSVADLLNRLLGAP